MADTPTTRPSLLVRLRDPRDEQAWAEFVAIYTPLIDRLARSRGLQAADGADLAQEAFRAVAAAIDGWDPDPARGSFRGWLFRIARNRAINLLRARGRQVPGSGDSNVMERLEQQPAPDDREEIAFDAEYRRCLFDRAAERVRGEFRKTTWRAFWETAVEGREASLVAAEIGLSVGSVYVARSRVMARLRAEVEAIEEQSGP
jgi:RNA polymerase sigma factor (sigma-70 family)